MRRWAVSLAPLLAAALLEVCGLASAEEEGRGEAAAFRWAQRKDRILITIDLQGVTDERFAIDGSGSFAFDGVGAYRDQREKRARYHLDLKLLKGLNASDSSCNGTCVDWKLQRKEDPQCTVDKESGPWEHCTLDAAVYNVTHCEVRARDVHCVLMKQRREAYWPHLLKDNTRPKHMSIDWSKWLDEDKDGVRWNDDVDRPWEWWKHEGSDDEDEESEEERERREAEERRQREKFRKAKKRKSKSAA